MFDALKKKFSFWIGQESKKEVEKKEKPGKTKHKSKQKEEKKGKVKRVKPSKEELETERKVTKEVMEDIEQEGLDTTAPDIKVQEAIDELKKEEEIDEEKKEKKPWWSFGKKKEEEIKEKLIENEQKKDNFFSKLVNKLSQAKLKEEDFEEAFQDLEITLLENNTALEAVDKIKTSLKQSLVSKDIRKSEIEKTIISSLKEAILSILIEPPNLLEQINSKPGTFTILFFGINGSGKTTSIAKIAHLLQKNGITSVMAAADTFRAASIEQLRTHAEKIKVPIISHEYGSDPAAVAFDAKKYAQQHNIKVVLIDTAGRMYTKTNLMKEMEKIVRVSQPDLKIFVGESITGNDAIEQARTFNESTGIDGIILSKADIDEKAGTILSVSSVTGKPIYYLGNGQDYDDLIVFSKKEVLKNLGLE